MGYTKNYVVAIPVEDTPDEKAEKRKSTKSKK